MLINKFESYSNTWLFIPRLLPSVLNYLILWMFYGVPFYNTCVLFHLILLFLWWNDYFFNVSRICFRDRFLFHNFFSDFISYQFSCYFSCFTGYFFGTDFSASSPVFVAMGINFFRRLSMRFPANDKITYLLKYFHVLGSTEYRVTSIY